MSVSCIIEFDNNPEGAYFAGQMLSGRITLITTKVRQVKGIALKIKGFAHTCWTHNSGSGSKKRSHSYNGHEDYIASLTYLLGSDGNQLVNIEPGTHCYTFQCEIPLTCPSSFEGHYGHVRYTVQVVLLHPWKFDQTFMKGFNVVKCVDINSESPNLRMPIETLAQKTFGFGPFASGPLKLNIRLPQSGYVPGQYIPISLFVTNDSKVPIEDFKVELVMLVNYLNQTQCSSQNERIVVSKMKGDPVQPYCNKQFTYMLHVPATPPTCLSFCRIIQIAYQTEVEAKVKGLHTNQVVCTPVTIGNIPLQPVVIAEQQAKDSMSKENESSNAKEEASVPSSCTADANKPPPAYEEAVHMPLSTRERLTTRANMILQPAIRVL